MSAVIMTKHISLTKFISCEKNRQYPLWSSIVLYLHTYFDIQLASLLFLQACYVLSLNLRGNPIISLLTALCYKKAKLVLFTKEYTISHLVHLYAMFFLSDSLQKPEDQTIPRRHINLSLPLFFSLFIMPLQRRRGIQ